tara:strand:- start:1401 stop:1898 length:498 start_codon:yes stop_codon:yes gene_type:complete
MSIKFPYCDRNIILPASSQAQRTKRLQQGLPAFPRKHTCHSQSKQHPLFREERSTLKLGYDIFDISCTSKKYELPNLTQKYARQSKQNQDTEYRKFKTDGLIRKSVTPYEKVYDIKHVLSTRQSKFYDFNYFNKKNNNDFETQTYKPGLTKSVSWGENTTTYFIT